MRLLAVFRDPDTPAWAAWTAMILCLGALYSVVLWAILSLIAAIQQPPGRLRAACAGTLLWPLLLGLVAFTLAVMILLFHVLAAAQSGMALPGARWPRVRKQRAVAAGAGVGTILWVSAGLSAYTSCARRELAANDVRRMVVVWFLCHAVLLCIGALCAAAERSTLWWRRRQVRLARTAYCEAQSGVEGTGAGERVTL